MYLLFYFTLSIFFTFLSQSLPIFQHNQGSKWTGGDRVFLCSFALSSTVFIFLGHHIKLVIMCAPKCRAKTTLSPKFIARALPVFSDQFSCGGSVQSGQGAEGRLQKVRNFSAHTRQNHSLGPPFKNARLHRLGLDTLVMCQMSSTLLTIERTPPSQVYLLGFFFFFQEKIKINI